MENAHRTDIILKFYKTMKFTKFKMLNEERKQELDLVVNKWTFFFKENISGYLSLMVKVSEKLMTSAKSFGLMNGDETAYFYIKLIDPDLKMLEIYECSNTKDEIKSFCLKNFGFYDNFFIFLERCYNERFHEYTSDELWTRDSIKR